MRFVTCCLVLLGAAAAGCAASLEVSKAVAIWPKGAPGETEPLTEHDTTGDKGPLVAGRRVIRLTDVGNPTITIYPAPRGRNSGAAVLVFPGGGYSILALDLEGTEVCEWLNTIGVTGVLLKYRVPARGGRRGAPLQDAQRAMGLVRLHAQELGINPQQIGALGFSAGAHLAANLSNNYERRAYDAVDDADRVSCRPDFAAIIYPGLITARNNGETLAPEIAVTPQTPPSFLLQAENDPVKVENSLLYFAALKKAKVPAEMHLFATGGHGYGLRHTAEPITEWPKLAERWMRTIGMLSQ